MSFLKKLGTVLANVGGMAIGVGRLPLAIPVFAEDRDRLVERGGLSELKSIENVIVQMESMGQTLGLAGPGKLKAAVPLVAQVILGSSLMIGRSIASMDLFISGVRKIADGIADVLNSFHEAGVQMVSTNPNTRLPALDAHAVIESELKRSFVPENKITFVQGVDQAGVVEPLA